jgi:hypothetical protein
LYPPDFPEELKPPIEHAIAEGELEWHQSGRAMDWIKPVFRTFSLQAGVCGFKGSWTPSRVREEVARFVARFIGFLEPDPERQEELLGELQSSEDWQVFLRQRSLGAEMASAISIPKSRRERAPAGPHSNRRWFESVQTAYRQRKQKLTQSKLSKEANYESEHNTDVKHWLKGHPRSADAAQRISDALTKLEQKLEQG